jgi:hypothetical protein
MRKIIVEVEMDESHIIRFKKFLKYIEYLGKTGKSKNVMFFVNGNSEIKPNFKIYEGENMQVVSEDYLGYIATF